MKTVEIRLGQDYKPFSQYPNLTEGDYGLEGQMAVLEKAFGIVLSLDPDAGEESLGSSYIDDKISLRIPPKVFNIRYDLNEDSYTDEAAEYLDGLACIATIKGIKYICAEQDPFFWVPAGASDLELVGELLISHDAIPTIKSINIKFEKKKIER